MKNNMKKNLWAIVNKSNGNVVHEINDADEAIYLVFDTRQKARDHFYYSYDIGKESIIKLSSKETKEFSKLKCVFNYECYDEVKEQEYLNNLIDNNFKDKFTCCYEAVVLHHDLYYALRLAYEEGFREAKRN